MAKSLRRRWDGLTAVALLLIAAGALTAWVCWPGCFSHVNYERIEKGMELPQVQNLLGSPGEEISFSEIPGVAPNSKFPEAPDGWLGVVWGERCFRWWDGDRRGLGDRYILVGVSGGRVVSKYLVEYSL